MIVKNPTQRRDPRFEARDLTTDRMKSEMPARLLRRWEKLWEVPGLASKASVTANPRLRSTLGRFISAKRRIELHPKLYRSETNLLPEVLCHEAAHLAVSIRESGRVPPHGKHWASLMRAAGFEPKVRPSRTCLPRRGVRRKLYEHRCPVCQTVRFASRPVPNWRCSSCAEAGLAGRMMISRRSA